MDRPMSGPVCVRRLTGGLVDDQRVHVTYVLAALRQIAASQGRHFQAVLDEALGDCIDRQQKEFPRRHLIAAFASSLDEFDKLYRELTK